MSRGSDRYLSLKFQEGDEVLVVDDIHGHRVRLGSVQRVIETDPDGDQHGLHWRITGAPGGRCGWVSAEEIVSMEKVREMFCKEAAS